MSCHELRLLRSFVLLCLVCLVSGTPCRLAAQNAGSLLTLSADRTSALVSQVVHLTATVNGGLGLAHGTVTFLDNGQPIASATLDSRGFAAVGIASFLSGSHTITAAYTGDSVYAAVSAGSSPTITVMPEPVAITASTLTGGQSGTVVAGMPLTVRILGLPAAASGTVSFADERAVQHTQKITGQSAASYIALGDSITYGINVAPQQAYPALFASSLSLALTNLGTPGYVACDVMTGELLPAARPSTQTDNPLYSLMIGTNDAFHGVDPAYELFFKGCHQATLAFLGAPREYKVLAGDADATVLSGPWTYTGSLSDGTWQTLFNAGGTGTARFTLTTSGAPIYVWYLVQNGVPGSFSLAVDGVMAEPGVQTSVAENSLVGAGYGLLRLPALAGTHTIDVTALSGQVGVLGVGTAPSGGAASTHPTVIVADVPNPSPQPGAVSQAAVDAFSADVLADVELLAPDGLDLRFVSTHSELTSTAAYFADYAHPTPLGHQQIAAALETLSPGLNIGNYVSFQNTVPAAPVTFMTAGQHAVAVAYQGDARYGAASSAPLPQTVVAAPSTTTLSTSAANLLANAPLTLAASVAPADATGSVTFADGGAALVTLPLTAGAVSWTTSALTPGAHALTASYSGDQTYGVSTSPSITVQVAQRQPVLAWAPLPAGGGYGSLTGVTMAMSPAGATGSVTLADTFTAVGQSGPVSLTLGSATLSNGQATLMLPLLGVGQHSLTAMYAGDADDLPATSPVATVTITALPTATTLAASTQQLAYGMPLTLTATIAPAAATGGVVFTDTVTGATMNATLTDGTAQAIFIMLAPGAHGFTASYAGDTTHTASVSPAIEVSITPAASAVLLPMPAGSLSAGVPLTLSATLVPVSATGLVTFHDQTRGVLGQAAVVNGVASLTLPAPTAGAYSVTAAYSGDAEDAAASSVMSLFSVSLRTTSLTLAGPSSAVAAGAALKLTATLSPSPTTGLIVFSDAAAGTLGSAQISGGVAQFSLATLAPGTHQIQAAFAGDANYQLSTSAVIPVGISAAFSSTTLTLAQPAVIYGTTATANVRVSTASFVTPSGLVTMHMGSAALPAMRLANAVAGAGYATFQIDTTTLQPGSYALTATYAGDANDLASDSSAIPATLLVQAVPVTATVTLSQSSVAPATPVTVSVALTGSGTTAPAGTVVFLLNGTQFASAPVQSATATALLPAQVIGTYSITANLLASGVFAAASSQPVTLTVTPPLALTVPTQSLSGAPGASLSASVIYTPLSGFSGAVTTTCSSPVSYLTCSIAAPAALSSAAGAVTAPVTITVANSLTASCSTPKHPGRDLLPLTALLFLPLLGVRRSRRAGVLMLLALSVLLPLTGCGGSPTATNLLPPGAQLLTITASAAGVTVSTNLTVTIEQ